MAQVKSKNTTPEMVVRKAAHALGLRFRLHNPDLPGKPDLVFHKVDERPLVRRRQDLFDQLRDVRAAVGPGLAKATAKARAIDQSVGDLKHRSPVPKARLKRFEFVRRDVQFERRLLHQQVRGADRRRPGRDVGAIAGFRDEIDIEPLVEKFGLHAKRPNCPMPSSVL
jgi:hypothetical protein